MARSTFILIDGHAVAYRSFFALPASKFITTDGQPTNAVYGFTSILFNIMDENPNYFAVTFDRGLSGRETLYPDYKGTREKMPDELASQMELIERLVKALNIPLYTLDGYEADDVIGTLVKQAEAKKCNVRIVTGDRDLLQLLSTHTTVQLPDRKRRGGKDKIWTVKDFTEKYKDLMPTQLIDIKALQGDSSDNIPGVMGVGEKGAISLLVDYGSINNLFDHVEDLPKKFNRYQSKLASGRDSAFLSYELARIKQDLPIELDLEKSVTHDFDPQLVVDLFDELQFGDSQRNRLENIVKLYAPERAMMVFVKKQAFVPNYTIVDSQRALDWLAQKLNTAEVITFDTETTSLDKMQAELVGIALTVDGYEGYYIPVGHRAEAPNENGQLSLFADEAPPPPQLDLQTVLEALRPALQNPMIGKVAHNMSYDWVVMYQHGIEVTPIVDDTMLMEWMINPINRVGLKDMARIRLDIRMKEYDEVVGTGKNKTTIDLVPINEVAKYAAADAVVTHQLWGKLQEALTDKPHELYKSIELPLIPVLCHMEMAGVKIDTDYLGVLAEDLTAQQNELEATIHQIAGTEFNINSYQQLNEILFERLHLPTEGLKKTKSGGFSLRADVIDDLADRLDHPILKPIIEYRALGKLLGTYIEALPKLVNPTTGRVHTSFNQSGTVTGRLSSSEPNLQNIPIRTENGRKVRRAFIAEEGNVLLSVDYSQIELRILAHYSEDPGLRSAFLNGEDIHRATAAKVHGIAPEKVTYNQRRFAKAVNFGLMYGMGAFRLARDSDLTLAEAEHFITSYFENFPGVKTYFTSVEAFAQEHGYVQTLMGRRRYFPELTIESGYQNQQRARREAINMPIQGTAADILKKAMIDLHDVLQKKHPLTRLTLQVHDELVLEVPESEIDAVKALVIETMERAGNMLDVPIVADAEVGKNWESMA